MTMPSSLSLSSHHYYHCMHTCNHHSHALSTITTTFK
jgi:hypothetical protein